MNQSLDAIKRIKDLNVTSIYADPFHLFTYDNCLVLHGSELLISFGTTHNLHAKFWLVTWEELPSGDDILIIKEQQTPEPFDYEVHDCHKYVVKASSYSTNKNVIKKVSGYGFIDSNDEKLSSIVIEMEDSFLHIAAAPVMEIRMTKEEPIIHESDSLLVSVKIKVDET